jgi:(p)ppGpp synthase/HD superfamily hydrolase
MGMQEMREELEDLSFRIIDPDAHAVVVQRLDALEARDRDIIGEIEAQLSAKLAKNGINAHVKPPQAAVLDLDEDGAQVRRL